MESKILYQLTMRCDSKQCELDLALYGIQDDEEEYVYLSKKKVHSWGCVCGLF